MSCLNGKARLAALAALTICGVGTLALAGDKIVIDVDQAKHDAKKIAKQAERTGKKIADNAEDFAKDVADQFEDAVDSAF